MASWTLVPCLVTLRDEFKRVAPNRDTSSDGSIGDAAHADRESDHNPDESGATHDEDSDSKNEVHAIDVDASGPWPSTMSMQAACDFLVKEHREGRDDRLQTIIHNGRIATNDNGWKWAYYSGSNSHTAYAHFSSEYTSGEESDTSPWGIAEKWGDDMPSVQEIWDHLSEDPYDKSTPPRKLKAIDWLRYVPSDQDVRNVNDDVNALDDKVEKLQAQVTTVAGQVEQILALLTPETTRTATPKSTRSK